MTVTAPTLQRRPLPDYCATQLPDSFLPELPGVLRRVYAARGIRDENDLDLSLSALLPPAGLKGIASAVDLLACTLREDGRIVIVGDFDADGATSCALAVRALEAMGCSDVRFLVPNRFEFGYGLTPEIVEIAALQKPALIVTVDNGISSVEGVAAAKKCGIAVLVTDHHLPPEVLPAADAIVNPNQTGCTFQSKALAGVGVTFYLMTALRSHLRDKGWFRERGISEPNMADYLDLVALGTVADVVPLDHNNRILVEDFIEFLERHDMPIPDALKGIASPSILIVDDEMPVAKSIQRVARRAGFDSYIATGGFQAGIMLSQYEPKVMTLDLSIPGMDGYSVIEFTREQSKHKDLKIVFTSLHGTSITLIPEVLKRAGYTNVQVVEEQAEPNGDFPTVKSPNPEEPEALQMAIDLANKTNADIVIGTDPDSDRLGIAVRDLDGKMKLMNGNQTMSLMTDFLINQWKETGKLNGNQFIGSTIVSTNLVNEIASSYGVETKVGLTGFKWIAKMIKDFPNQEFIGGGEESFGYMVGDFVRDKDAVTSTLLACEIATKAKTNGSSFYKDLLELYTKNHFYKEHLISIVKKGMDGAAQIKQMMIDLRNNPFTTIDGSKVEFLCDYQSSIKKNLITGEETVMDIPKSNVLIYHTEDGTKIAARPSGTEPKIKFYFSVKSKLDSIENAVETEEKLDEKIQRIIKALNL